MHSLLATTPTLTHISLLTATPPMPTHAAPQVKRLLPDPPSTRGVVYSRDPSIVLDDAILRPPSAPSSPSKPTPLGVAAAAPVAGGAAGVDGLAEMEVDGDEAQVLPAVPMNQQRKDAIRAKATTGGSGGGSVASPGAAAGLAAALQAASLQPLTAVKEAQGSGAAPAPGIRAVPAAGGQQRLDWLSSVFGKDSGKSAASGGGGASQDMLGTAPVAPAGKAAAGSGGTTINLTATAVGGQWAGSGVERVDMRPSSVTVRPGSVDGWVGIQHLRTPVGLVPGLGPPSPSAAPAVNTHHRQQARRATRRFLLLSALLSLQVGLPEAPVDRSANSVARLMNYLSGRSGSVSAPQR